MILKILGIILGIYLSLVAIRFIVMCFGILLMIIVVNLLSILLTAGIVEWIYFNLFDFSGDWWTIVGCGAGLGVIIGFWIKFRNPFIGLWHIIICVGQAFLDSFSLSGLSAGRSDKLDIRVSALEDQMK